MAVLQVRERRFVLLHDRATGRGGRSVSYPYYRLSEERSVLFDGRATGDKIPRNAFGVVLRFCNFSYNFCGF